MRLVRITSPYFCPIICIGSMTACPPPPPPPPPPEVTMGSIGAPPDISISPSDNFTILLERLDTVSARVRVPGAPLRFRSSQPDIVRVDSITGIIRGVSLGTATITAAREGSTSPASSVDVTVLPPQLAMSPTQRRQMVR